MRGGTRDGLGVHHVTCSGLTPGPHVDAAAMRGHERGLGAPGGGARDLAPIFLPIPHFV